MAIGTGAAIGLLGTKDTLGTTSADGADAAFSIAGELSTWANYDDAPQASLSLLANYSDAPDAKGKFKELSCDALADWLIKSRKGNKKKIVGSLNQQIVFNRKRNPSYAKKMKCARNKAMRKLDNK